MTQRANSHAGGLKTGEVSTLRNPMAAIRASISLGRNLLAMLSAFRRIGRTLFLRSINRSDYARWSNQENLEAWWETRTQRIATMIPIGSRVLEFGAGHRRLESYLDPSCSYIPSDLVDRGPGTIICDLNQRPFPDLTPIRPDVAVFIGVLEYVKDLPPLIHWLSHQVQMCAASYAYATTRPKTIWRVFEHLHRAYYGYMNTYTKDDLADLFRRSGFRCVQKDTWNDQRLFLFQRLPQG